MRRIENQKTLRAGLGEWRMSRLNAYGTAVRGLYGSFTTAEYEQERSRCAWRLWIARRQLNEAEVA